MTKPVRKDTDRMGVDLPDAKGQAQQRFKESSGLVLSPGFCVESLTGLTDRVHKPGANFARPAHKFRTTRALSR